MGIIRIDPEAWYTEEQLRMGGLDGQAIAKARRLKELRSRKVGSKIWYKGSWLLEWLEREPEEAATA